jgi:nucleoside-diphosphate-sugar epimerase
LARVLVTGAAGFIGSHLCEALASQGYEVTGLDCFMAELYPSEQKRRNWVDVKKSSPNVDLLELDLRGELDPSVFSGFDYVFHLAAMPGLSLSWTNFSLYSDCNTLATNNLINALDTQTLKKFFYISTSSVYGEIVDGDEQSPLKPISPYGVTKLAGENLLSAYAKAKSFDFSIIRLFSVYGPRQRSDMAFNIFLRKILSGEQINIYGDGTQSRANTYVIDVADGIISAMFNSKSSEIYNICGKNVYSVLEVINTLERITGKSANLNFVEERLGDQKRTFSVGSKARLELGFDPKTELEAGLRQQYDWQIKNYSL